MFLSGSTMTIGIWRGKELVESLGEVGEFVSFSTAISDSEELWIYAKYTQMASETGCGKGD